MKKLLAFLFILSAPAWNAAVSAAPAEIIMIRHGEKPPSGNELNDQGWQRANALAGFFTSEPAVLTFGTPVAFRNIPQRLLPGDSQE
jgi:hypothetical protein